jgi:hypothetical protein
MKAQETYRSELKKPVHDTKNVEDTSRKWLLTMSFVGFVHQPRTFWR